MKRLVYLLLTLGMFGIIRAQNIDDAHWEKQLQNSQNPVEKTETLLQMAFFYHPKDSSLGEKYLLAAEKQNVLSENDFLPRFLFIKGNIQVLYGNKYTSFLYFKSMKTASEAVHSDSLLAWAWLKMGESIEEQGKYQSAIHYFLKAEKMFHINKDEVGKIDANDFLSATYRKIGKYQEAFERYMVGLKKAYERKDITNIEIIYWNISYFLFEDIKVIPYSIYFQLPSLQISYFQRKWYGVSINYATLGEKLTAIGDTANAARCFQLSLTYIRKAPLNNYLCSCLTRIAVFYFLRKNYAGALSLLEEVIETAKKSQYFIYQYKASVWKGLTLMAMHQNDLAEKILLEAEHIESQDADFLLKVKLAQALSTIYEQRGEYKKVWVYEQKISDLQNMYYSRHALEELGTLRGRFEVFKKLSDEEQRNEKIKNNEMKQLRREKNILYFSITVVVIILLSIALILMLKNKAGWLSNILSSIGILLLFEFILVLMDPWLDKYASDTPLARFLANVALAMTVAPLHGWLNRTLKGNPKTRREQVKLLEQNSTNDQASYHAAPSTDTSNARNTNDLSNRDKNEYK